MDAKEINAILKKTRDAKFRKKTDGQLEGTNKLIIAMREWWARASDEEKQARWDKIGETNKGRDLKWLYENNPELRETKSQALKEAYRKGTKKHPFKGKHLDKEHREKISKGNAGKTRTSEQRQNVSRAKKGMDQAGGNFKPVKTPYGVFSSLREAAEFEQPITGKKYRPNRMTNLLKDPNSGYEKISREEYERLKND